MRKNEVLIQSPRPFIVAVIIAGTIYMGGNVWSSSKSQKSVIKVNNHTENCKVIDAEKLSNQIKLTMRNDSPKAIMAYLVSYSSSDGTIFSVEEDSSFSELTDSVIPSGGFYEKVFYISTSINNQKNIPLDLMAVIFDDKTNEGDQGAIRGIEDQRLGGKAQITHAITQLNQMLTYEDKQIPAYFNKTFKPRLMSALQSSKGELLTQLRKERSRGMSRQVTDELPDGVEAGLHNGEEYVMRLIENLEDSMKMEDGASFRNDLLRTKQTLERVASKL